jgi:hypothetical protein
VPEPGSMTDEELRARIREIRAEEEQVSYQRRLLHGRIDVVRSEILSRIGGREDRPAGDDASLASLLDRLTDVLVHKGPPPIDQELERLGADDHGRVADVDVDEELPALEELSNDDLAGLVHGLARRERGVSDRRNELHAEIESLRAQHVARLRDRYAGRGPDG